MGEPAGFVELLVFDLRGPLAHFRRPDTTATHVSYPMITRTALRGLLGAILGVEDFTGGGMWTGIQLQAPVRTVAQEMSMIGKGFLGPGGRESFNRPTSIELVVTPAYRVFYLGPQMDELARRIAQRQSAYPTYLGAAYALTVPEWVGQWRARELAASFSGPLTAITVVPTHAVERLELVGEAEYGRVGGMVYQHLGGRRFRGTVNILYETRGGPFSFRPRPGPVEPQVRFFQLDREGGRVVALW